MPEKQEFTRLWGKLANNVIFEILKIKYRSDVSQYPHIFMSADMSVSWHYVITQRQRHTHPREQLLFQNYKAQRHTVFFTPQSLRAVGVLFSPMVSRWVSGWACSGKKFVWAVSQKP